MKINETKISMQQKNINMKNSNFLEDKRKKKNNNNNNKWEKNNNILTNKITKKSKIFIK